MTTNYRLLHPDSHYEDWELKVSSRATMLGIFDCLASVPTEQALDDMWIFPNLITDDLCRKAPPAFFLSTEFDSCRRAAEQGAEVYRKNNNLLAFGLIGGAIHCSYLHYNDSASDAWFNAFKAFFDKYL